ncbi:MAG: hypothetical protein V9H26_08235 [Verrucomicrobiota bacterium]
MSLLRRSDFLQLAVLGLLAGTLASGWAAVPITPELQQMSEADRARQIQFDAQVSLREKIQVGTQRYEDRQAFRQALVNGMREQADARQEEIAGNRPALGESPEHKGFGSTNMILAVFLLFAGFLAFRYWQKQNTEVPSAY